MDSCYSKKLWITLFLLSTLYTATFCYKPVVIIHGILAGAESMQLLQRQIQYEHPGTKVYTCDLFSNWNSLENAWRQVNELIYYIDSIGKLHPEGIILLGYSQGGLLARATLQAMPEHNVKTFISLSSPQAGQFGAGFLRLIFPDLAAKTAYKLFYSTVGQQTSVANYWNDPHHNDLYLKFSNFLPFVNNEILTSNSTRFRNSLLKLDKMVLIGGPNDGVITPWQSSHFGYFNGSLDIIPFDELPIYTSDTLGLRTLAEHGKLMIIVKPGVHHLSWHRRLDVIEEIILPYLT